jgi:hypothetical protein
MARELPRARAGHSTGFSFPQPRGEYTGCPNIERTGRCRYQRALWTTVWTAYWVLESLFKGTYESDVVVEGEFERVRTQA